MGIYFMPDIGHESYELMCARVAIDNSNFYNLGGSRRTESLSILGQEDTG